MIELNRWLVRIVEENIDIFNENGTPIELLRAVQADFNQVVLVVDD